jgi:hypothetical protein
MRLIGPALDPQKPLPHTLDYFETRLALSPS